MFVIMPFDSTMLYGSEAKWNHLTGLHDSWRFKILLCISVLLSRVLPFYVSEAPSIVIVWLSSSCFTGVSRFVLSVAASVSHVPNMFLLLHETTERISIKFAGGSHCHERIKWLHSWNRNKGAGYERKFESTSIGFAAVSNRCSRLANEFTN